MNAYHHHVSGFFSNRDDANIARSQLIARGFPPEQLQIFVTDTVPSEPLPQHDSNAVLKDVLVDSAVGTAIGTGLGALAEVALVAANVTLLVASPLVAPLAMLGWGAFLGGTLGAAAGTVSGSVGVPGKKEGWLSELVRDAIASGQIVLLAITRTEQETATAREVIEAAVGEAKDIRIP
ncbi:MAG: hypothetical protein A3F78_14090 [Burkholderiales bacterium RIFCSPLOWO2_12_FULL_61_40]|nr:MAG: hypothetical protein A3F78_14090 [Burkholderiales bacterium RIFCSPLOWO2_12_FULL_61_40]